MSSTAVGALSPEDWVYINKDPQFPDEETKKKTEKSYQIFNGLEAGWTKESRLELAWKSKAQTNLIEFGVHILITQEQVGGPRLAPYLCLKDNYELVRFTSPGSPIYDAAQNVVWQVIDLDPGFNLAPVKFFKTLKAGDLDGLIDAAIAAPVPAFISSTNKESHRQAVLASGLTPAQRQQNAWVALVVFLHHAKQFLPRCFPGRYDDCPDHTYTNQRFAAEDLYRALVWVHFLQARWKKGPKSVEYRDMNIGHAKYFIQPIYMTLEEAEPGVEKAQDLLDKAKARRAAESTLADEPDPVRKVE